jgi:pyridoxal phosphate enzyme (YggS family)
MSSILINLQAIRQQIVQTAQSINRSVDEIRLLAVSKNFDASVILEAVEAGQTAFAENYVQEALSKVAAVQSFAPDLDLEWHFIGPIQSNKTRFIAQHFSWVHSVDRLKIAQRLSEQRPAQLSPLNICLQINVSEEHTKSGILVDQALEVARQIAVLPNLRLRGLMAIPKPAETLELQRAPYRKMKQLQEQLNQYGLNLDTLSIGMSDDFQAAILEGSTMVRIGAAIFGKRNHAQ